MILHTDTWSGFVNLSELNGDVRTTAGAAAPPFWLQGRCEGGGDAQIEMNLLRVAICVFTSITCIYHPQSNRDDHRAWTRSALLSLANEARLRYVVQRSLWTISLTECIADVILPARRANEPVSCGTLNSLNMSPYVNSRHWTHIPQHVRWMEVFGRHSHVYNLFASLVKLCEFDFVSTNTHFPPQTVLLFSCEGSLFWSLQLLCRCWASAGKMWWQVLVGTSESFFFFLYFDTRYSGYSQTNKSSTCCECMGSNSTGIHWVETK